MTLYKRLVLSGGSTKGFCYIGILKYLEEKEIIRDIEEIVSCSIGALFAMFITLGYSYLEMYDIFTNVNLNNLHNFKIQPFIKSYGLDYGYNLENFIKIFITSKGYNEDITLSEIYDKTKINIITTATNVNNKETIFISKDNFPDIPLYLAVRISMTIPLLFSPVIYKNIYYVDGGLTCNFPIRYYIENNILTETEEKEILCIAIKGDRNINTEINNIKDYLYNIIKASFSKIDNIDKNIAISKGLKVLEINVDVKSAINFEVSNETKEYLINEGYNSIANFHKEK